MWENLRGTPEAILVARTDAEMRVSMLEAMPYRGRMFVMQCNECAHAVHHSPCEHAHCSCPVEHGEAADEEIAEQKKDAERRDKYARDLAEARAAVEAERQTQ